MWYHALYDIIAQITQVWVWYQRWFQCICYTLLCLRLRAWQSRGANQVPWNAPSSIPGHPTATSPQSTRTMAAHPDSRCLPKQRPESGPGQGTSANQGTIIHDYAFYHRLYDVCHNYVTIIAIILLQKPKRLYAIIAISPKRRLYDL